MLDAIGTFLTRYRGYMFGQGFVWLAVFAASTMGGSLIPAMIVAGCGIGLSVYQRLSKEHFYQQEMLELYRDDIAEHLGIAPARVTIADLKTAAIDNEVMAQALERQHKKTIIGIGTSILAGVVTFGLIDFFKMGDIMKGVGSSLSGTIGPIAKLIGIGTVGTLSNLVLHDVLGFAIGAKTGVSKAAAHDLIVELNEDVKRGRSVSKEEVYAVLVAGDERLQQSIAQQFHEPYSRMSRTERSVVLARIGVTEEMQGLADAINEGSIRPGRLAYLIDDARDASRAAKAAPAAEEELQLDRSNFVEKYASAPAQAESFTARENARRGNPATLSI